MANVPVKAIEKLVEYLWHDESKHDMGEPDHIFRSVAKVARWLSTHPDVDDDWRPDIKRVNDAVRDVLSHTEGNLS